MRIPVITGIIRRRLLVNFRADQAAVRRILPHPFRPKLHRGHAIVGICLIRLERIRPSGMPGLLGVSSENAAHRVAVEWTDPEGAQREGVFIPRRDTSSLLNRLVGGRLFPGEHHLAKFVVSDSGSHVELAMRSLDASVSLSIIGDDAESLPASSCFGSLAEASSFFEGGGLGYSATRDGNRLDGLFLRTLEWRVRAMALAEVRSSYFSDESRFPKGSVVFDHALIMRDLAHEWVGAKDMSLRQRVREQSPGPTPLPAVSRTGIRPRLIFPQTIATTGDRK